MSRSTYRRKTTKIENNNKNSLLNQTITCIIILIALVIINLNKSNKEDSLSIKINKIITNNSIVSDVENASKYLSNIFSNVKNIYNGQTKDGEVLVTNENSNTEKNDRVDFEVLEKLNKKEEENYEKSK